MKKILFIVLFLFCAGCSVAQKVTGYKSVQEWWNFTAAEANPYYVNPDYENNSSR